jgi:hypothetical protein
MPVLRLIQKFLKRKQNDNPAENIESDIYIVSYPNSGRTWLKILIGKALCEQFGIDEKLLLDLFALTKAAGIPTIQLTHDRSQENTKADQLVYDKKYNGKKIILLFRDPKDVLVSYYFQQVKRGKRFEGTISEFIRNDKTGIRKLLAFNTLWYNNVKNFEDFLLISYEELTADTAAAIRKALGFVGMENIDPELIEKAVQFANFKNMRDLESQDYWKDHLRAHTMQTPNREDDESYKARRGMVGGYVDYLNQEDIDFINHVIESMDYPLAVR